MAWRWARWERHSLDAGPPVLIVLIILSACTHSGCVYVYVLPLPPFLVENSRMRTYLVRILLWLLALVSLRINHMNTTSWERSVSLSALSLSVLSCASGRRRTDLR